jgi:hypothetical protein
MVSKNQGGMKNGSLDRLLEVGKLSDDNFFKTVNTRVMQRFQLLESIRTSGYKPNHDSPVKVIKGNKDQYKLFSGHHRVAILAVLEYDIVPNVYVFENNFMYLLFKCRRKIKGIFLI